MLWSSQARLLLLFFTPNSLTKTNDFLLSSKNTIEMDETFGPEVSVLHLTWCKTKFVSELGLMLASILLFNYFGKLGMFVCMISSI